MKENNLTQMDEASFVKAYSDPKKSAEIHKFMVDNKLTNLDATAFHSAYFDPSKKKGGTTQGSGQPVQQPGKPSAPSFGQKVTEKIINSSTQVPFKTSQQDKEPVQEKKKTVPSKYFEVDVTEPQDVTAVKPAVSPVEMRKRESISMATPQKIAERENKQKADKDFYREVASKEVFEMPTYFESKEYASDITADYLNYLQQIDPEKGTYTNEKYKVLKAKSKEDRTAVDESFLRQVETEAINKVYDANYERLQLLGSNIDNLEKTAVTPSDRSKLDYMYKEYEKISNSLKGISATYDQNNLQYGKIAGQEMQSEENKRKAFEEIQAGEGKTKAFFTAVGDAAMDGILNMYQFPKVMGDLMGDKDYDWSDEFYDSISGAKSVLDVDLAAPLPQGARMSDLPFVARAAVVGGNAIGTMGIFALGGATGGATKLGQRAATYATAFLTQESNYYQEALEGGMSPQDAAITGTYLAAQMALFETIMPDIGYLNAVGFKKGVVSGTMQAMKSGLPAKEAAKLAFKNAISALPENALTLGSNIVKSGGKEFFAEELPQNLAEDTAKEIINNRSQKTYFNDTFNVDNYVDAAIGSFIAAGSISGASSMFSKATPKSPVQEEVMRQIVENRDKFFAQGTDADRKVSPEGKKEVEDAGEILDAMKAHSGWNQMSKEEQDHAFALAQQADVMKKEQERMKELRIPDERKDAEIKRLEDEVNEMFSIQLEQEKQKAKDAKLKAIEDDFNKSMEGEEFPVQEDERDQEIVELQKQREEKGVSELDTFLSDMKPMVPFAVERTEQGLPVAQSVKQAASNYLYKKYKELTDMKSDPNRMMTRGQIASVQKQLEQDIRTLEGTAETKTEARDQENIQGIPSQVREGQEPIQAQPVEVPSAEAPEAGGVLQAQEEVTPTEKIKSNWNYEGEGDAFASNKESREGKSSYVTRILDTIGVGKSYNRAKQRGELDVESPLTYKGDKESISAIDGNGNKVGVIELQSDGGVQHLAVAPEFSRKGVATELIKQIEQKGAKVRFEKSKRISPDAAKLFNKLQSLKDQETAPEVTPEVTVEPVVKPSRRERLAKMFETSEGEIAAEKVASFLGEANIGVEVLDPKSFEEKGKQRNFEGSADGIFLVDNNTGKIYLNKERIKGAEGKTIAFHEGIHPVVNIIRNTNPKLYRAIVDGLKAEAVKNAGVAEAAEAVASSGYYQEQGPSAIEEETVVETMARVAAGDIDIDTFEPSFREKFIEFMNKLAKMLGLKPIAVNSPRMEVKRLADQLSKALNKGGKISDVVGKENVGEFQNKVGAQKRAVSIAKGKESLVKYGLKKGVNTTRKIGEALEKRSRELYGIISREDRSEKALKAISSFMADEVRFFVEAFGENSGKGWYGEKFQKGLDAMAAIFPEMKDDQNARDLFTMLVAITSDGTEVMQNFQQASLAYKNYKETGKMPTTAKAQRAESYMVNFRNIQDLLDKYNGDVQAIKKELLTIESISELNQQRKAQGLEKLDTKWPASFKVPLAASIFGPKLGMFYANLSGMEQYPTLDRWWSRTFNRYRGTLIPQITRGYNKKGEALGIDRYREIAGLKDASEEEVLARIVQDHDTYEDKGYKKGTPAEKAANTLYKKLYVELNDAPFGAKDRQFMYDAFIDTQKKLKRSGIDVTIADIQAILWYFEKNLYKKLGVTKPIQGISYEDAANKTYEKWKNSGNSFNYTIKDSEQGETIDEVDIDEETVPTVQPSKGIKRGNNLVKDTYYESGLTEDKNDYIFFHVSSAPEASIRKGIDSTKYTSLRTAREEKGLQYGVASYYTRPEDGERMVGGEKYAVRVPKAKVYPIDSDPLGYGEKAEAKIPQGTPFRGEAVKREIADMAKKNGYEMIVGEWSYSRTGKPAGELPEFRADALVPLKPTKEKPESFTSNAEKGMERIPFPSQQSEQAKQELESIASEVRDIMSSKKKFSSKEYQLADSVYMSGQVTENKYEDNEFKRDITPEEYDMMTKVLPKSMQADAARVRGLLFGKKGQASIGIPRGVKQFSDNVSGTVDRIKAATSEDGATLNLDGSTYEDGGLVVPAGSINVAQDDVSAEGLFEFLKDNEGNISSDIFKIGLYKFPDRPEVSYDLNIVIPREYRDVALKFGELAGQESLFDLDTFENIKTGSDGKNPRKFTAQELAEIAKDLSEGRLPKIVSKQGQPSMVKRNALDKRIDEAIDRKKYFVANDMGGVDVYTPENYIKVLQEFVDTGAISGKAAPYTQLTERQFPLEYINGISLLRLTDNDRSFVQDEIDYVKSKMAKGQPSMVKRTSAEVQRLMEDSMDSVDEAIADGVDAQTAVEDNITSQDWYSELTPKQKEQFDEIIKDEFGVTPKAPVAKPTGIKATIANIIDNYYKGDRESKAANTQILESDPKLKYIYRNIEEINKQLQNAGVITDKTDGCP